LYGVITFQEIINDYTLYGFANKKTEFTDIAIGGRTGEILYVLDKYVGVTLVNVTLNKQKVYEREVNTKLGIISITSGFKID
jgi:hypothetical protein